ncbi:MAG: hypothetical protein C5B59_20735 [Bacteroidetes bacterium]|nr:MAG: hypothetical protein C5B59_20735 [Bacteroidota bacterium]
MSFAVCCVSISPLRSESSHKSEMVSQLLFGERCLVLDESNKNWVRIKCQFDGYEGWCQDTHVRKLDESRYYDSKVRLSSEWVSDVELGGRHIRIPMGSSLPNPVKRLFEGRDGKLNFSGKLWDPAGVNIEKKKMKKIAFAFLNTPYLWGGRSVFGTDCSGFTQSVFKFFHINLLRDAWQQATQGAEVKNLQQSKFGDLAFFDNEEGKVVHVGILLGKQKIVHASGKVRIDAVDTRGIINSDTGFRSHQLCSIKRFF